ncbi:MAG: methionine gamma-lyase family protein, partial [Cyanobacteria bacterium J06639_1]
MSDRLNHTFTAIDRRVRANLERVLAAMKGHKVGAHHFSGVTGYGYDDMGRDTLDRVFAEVMGAEAAIVRLQFVSGTHAIACALFGCLRPGDELVSVAGKPYDTLEETIGLRGSGSGSLREFGIAYRQLDLTAAGTLDWQALPEAIHSRTRVVHIQRSCGYDWRASISVEDIGKIVAIAKARNPDAIVFVDNCYGEFVETSEPCHVG